MAKYPFGTVTITPYTRRLIKKALDSGRVSGGRLVRDFERKFAALVGSKEAVAVSSGTDAVALALAVLYDSGARRNDEVIVPALSFAATGNAVLQAGFTPIFVDIQRHTLNINPEKVEGAITEKTKAILVVHLMGKPADMDAITRIAKKHKLFLIEDAAEAQGARYKGKNVGTLGDMAAFSLYIAHIISTVEGGIIATNNRAYAEVARSLRAHGRACKCDACIINVNSSYCAKRFHYNEDVRFIFERIGFSAKMNELEAAFGLGYLKAYDTIFRRRKKNVMYLRKRFEKFNRYFYTTEEAPDEEIAPYAFPIIVKEKTKFKREQFIHFLEKNGIEARTLFASMPTQCAGFAFLGHEFGDFPQAEYIGKNGLHIGVHQGINRAAIDYFIKTTEKFLLTHTT